MLKMQKYSAKTKYHWQYRGDDVQCCAEDVKNMVRSLMETQTVDDVGLLQLKAETYPLCNPTIIMDLRHQRKPVMRGLVKYRNNDAVKDAKRMIKAEELERLTIEKELQSIDAQINSFQKDLDCYRVKVNRKFEDRHKNTMNKNRQCETHRISVADVEELLQESISYNERLLKNKNKQAPSLALVSSFSSSYMDSSTSESSLHSVENLAHKQQNETDTSGDLNSFTICDSSTLDNQNLMIKTWNRWRTFIKERKLINPPHQVENVSKLNAEYIENKKLLKKYFTSWYKFSKEEQLLKYAPEKMQQKQKINKFLATLKERKQTVRKKNKNNFIEIKSKSASNINECLLDAGSGQKEIGNKHNTKILPYYLRGTSFRHRFQAQQNIIAEQKSKLEEQKKIIEELKLAQLKKDSEKSKEISHEHLSQTLQTCSTVLKPKAKYLCRSMPSAIESAPEIKQNVVPSLIIQPKFLSIMAERAQERQKRWKLIQEKKRIQKEERQRQEREKEQKILQQEKEERKLMLEVVQKLKIIEKEKEIKRQQEKERLKALNKKALEFYRIYLLRKYGINAFKTMISLRDSKIENAEAHYRKQLLCRNFLAWKSYIQNYMEWKICQVDAFYRNLLMRSYFRRLKELLYEYKMKKQVALDFYDLYVQKRVFTEWHHIVCLNHIERIGKMEKAKLHYERKLLVRCLHHWIKFPEVKLKEKQRELRKEFWRSKVQELLPDFRHVLSTGEIISHHKYLY